MIKKHYSKTGNYCRVTFKYQPAISAEKAVLCGDFNDWAMDSHPMRRLKDGSFSATVSLQAKQSYRFRYLLDGQRWENDPEANNYVPNAYGSDDSVVEI